MENNFDMLLNGILEKLAYGYEVAKNEWLADKKNTFKDGRFLAYYEAKEAILKHLSTDGLDDALEALAKLYRRAKADWSADRRNPFKDGRFLACFEILNMIPAAN